MTEALYLNDSYLKEFTAVVNSVKDGKFVVLDRTAFYPSSGGQPHDTGKLIRLSDNREFTVVFCGKFNGEISHEVVTSDTGADDSSNSGSDINSDGALKEGDQVKGLIDWDRRYKLMRAHTSAHIVSGLFSKKIQAKITGNQLELDKVRIDFNLDNFDRDVIESLITESNELIQQDLLVKNYELPRSEVESDPDMCKLAMGLPPGIQNLRITEIVGFDRQPDGGTHVKNLKEIGKLAIIKMENKGKINRRVYYKLVDKM